MKIILASKSKHRRILLENLGLKFDIIPSNIDEEPIQKLNIPLNEKLVKLAQAKAHAVASTLGNDCLIIASDLMIDFNGEEIGKPRNKLEAFQMLKSLSGKIHKIISGTCIINNKTKQEFLDFSSMNVKFREISDYEIMEYVEINPVTEYAAAYGENSFELFDAKLSGDNLRFGIDPDNSRQF